MDAPSNRSRFNQGFNQAPYWATVFLTHCLDLFVILFHLGAYRNWCAGRGRDLQHLGVIGGFILRAQHSDQDLLGAWVSSEQMIECC